MFHYLASSNMFTSSDSVCVDREGFLNFIIVFDYLLLAYIILISLNELPELIKSKENQDMPHHSTQNLVIYEVSAQRLFQSPCHFFLFPRPRHNRYPVGHESSSFFFFYILTLLRGWKLKCCSTCIHLFLLVVIFRFSGTCLL